MTFWTQFWKIPQGGDQKCICLYWEQKSHNIKQWVVHMAKSHKIESIWDKKERAKTIYI